MNRLHLRLSVAATLAALLIGPALAGRREVREKFSGGTFYLQHNLFYDGDSAAWENFILTPDFVPIGTKMTVRRVGREEVALAVEGRDEKLYLQIEDCAPDLETVLDRILGNEPPSLDGFGDVDLKGIRSGRILEGMSRQAVFRAVGYPPYRHAAHDVGNPDLEADELTWMKGVLDRIIIKFDDGKVASIDD
ncbi:MAG TPA: hypothetical protein VGK94_12690 [Candidatus Polarisedimenticolia bacterium]|jgi:hypothetical protein